MDVLNANIPGNLKFYFESSITRYKKRNANSVSQQMLCEYHLEDISVIAIFCHT